MSQNKACQNCKKSFEILPSDLEFYNRLSVPPPTFCPNCRQQRRLAFRNERVLYSRKCDAPGHDENLITTFHPDAPYKVVDSNYWWSDIWDPLEYGRDYDFSKPFFEQMLELQKEVPRPNAAIMKSENCDYANLIAGSKNCYMVVSVERCEDCYFGARMFYSKDCCDCETIYQSELCYECFQATKCYRCTFSERIENCRDIHFCYDCQSCNNCFGCTTLRNKNYCFLNEQLEKEDYEKKVAQAKTNTRDGIERMEKLAKEAHLKYPRRFVQIIKSENCLGDNIFNSKNCINSFTINESKNVDYSLCVTEGFNVMDASYSDFCEQVYENMSSEHDSRKKFCCFCWECHDVEYCDSCHSGCSDLFGCIGMSHGQYCVLNKKYSQDEYEKLVGRIKKHMDEMPYTSKSGHIYKYGEYFPPEFSTFAYNETVALEFYPLDKESALKGGFSWRDSEEKTRETTLKADKLPQAIAEVSEEMLEQTIACEHAGKCSDPCTFAFKIVGRELEFYKKMGLPLPTLCPMCRHFERVRLRNPLHLYHRKCMNEGCENEFETTYAPDRPEKVYCEKCYQQSVV